MANARKKQNTEKADVYTETVEGYIHLLSPVKTALNSTTNYFDCQLQTAEEKTIRLVCYSPKNRTNLQQAYEKHSPVKIVGTEMKERDSTPTLKNILLPSMQK